MGVNREDDQPQDVVGQFRGAGSLIPCQDLYSEENTGFICISQLFGTFQYWWFIAEIENSAIFHMGTDLKRISKQEEDVVRHRDHEDIFTMRLQWSNNMVAGDLYSMESGFNGRWVMISLHFCPLFSVQAGLQQPSIFWRHGWSTVLTFSKNLGGTDWIYVVNSQPPIWHAACWLA